MNSPKNGSRFYLWYWLVARSGHEGPPRMGVENFGGLVGGQTIVLKRIF